MEPLHADRPKRSIFRLEPWPTAIVLFFVVVVVVNILFIRMSMRSWTGLVTEGAYDKGLAYNRVLEANKVQDAMGWQVALDDGELWADREARLRLTLLDRGGTPVRGAQVEGRLLRPVQSGSDLEFVMTELEPGRYEVRLHLPLPGVWDLKLLVRQGAAEYRLVRRMQTRSAGLGG
ncbi:MAG: FixH family protein [Magnetococcales bacterium]|nr:FixH family protein [Magnetococcales bacterium]